MDVQRSLSDIYNKCDLAHDTRSHLGAQEALQRAYRVCSARLCKKRHNGVHLGLDPVVYHFFFPPRRLSAGSHVASDASRTYTPYWVIFHHWVME